MTVGITEYVIDDNMDGHVLSMRVYPQGRHAAAAYRAVCSCKAYSSRRHSYPGKAENAGRDHLRSKRA